MYDYLVVGAGLFGGVFTHEMTKHGKSVLVIEKRNHVAGNIYTEEVEGIQVHKYGAHIFHTSNKEVWDYVQQFAEFNRYTNSPVANYKGKLFNLPFNMNTFYQMWGVTTPAEAKKRIAQQVSEAKIDKPRNLEEQCISMVGRDIYETLVKGYTEKQWGKSAVELPPFIISRLPVRFIFDNNYFNDKYQGIPIGGYTQIVEKMLKGSEVLLNTDFFSDREHFATIAKKVIYTGMIDKYFDYCFGNLEYRSLRFETEVIDCDNYQGNAVVNFTEYDVPYTRIIEHKHFDYGSIDVISKPRTVITKEYPQVWDQTKEPYYPVNNDSNNALLRKYVDLSAREGNTIFNGRLGSYKYYDMHNVIAEALACVKRELQ